MNRINITLFFSLIVLVNVALFGQNVPFDNLTAGLGTNKEIVWKSSTYGLGFGHRIVNSDPGGKTLLHFQARHNKGTWSNAMILTSQGRLGIGIDDPLEALHLNGSIRGNSTGGALRVKTASGYLDLGSQNSGWAHIYTDLPKIIFNKDVYTTSNAFSSYNNDLILKTKGTERLRINDENGFLGIGETLPLAKLHVSTGTGTSQYPNVESKGDMLQFLESGNNGIEIGSSDELNARRSWVLARHHSNSNGLGKYYSTLHLQPSVGDKSQYRGVAIGYTANMQLPLSTHLAVDGNVGIGTTTPAHKLHVSEGVQLRKTTIGATIASADNGWVRDDWMTGSYGPAKWNATTKKWVRPGGSYNDVGGIIWQDEGTYFIRDYKGDKLEYTNQELLDKSFLFADIITGNVGIGSDLNDTEFRNYKLSVNGKVRATEVKVYTGWADYVFQDDYNLPTLQEVAQHIQEKGHLINIPSAAEVEENGIQLGEMNAKLLEKIEELTLYTLEQQKEIEALKKQNAKINKLEQQLNSLLQK